MNGNSKTLKFAGVLVASLAAMGSSPINYNWSDGESGDIVLNEEAKTFAIRVSIDPSVEGILNPSSGDLTFSLRPNTEFNVEADEVDEEERNLLECSSLNMMLMTDNGIVVEENILETSINWTPVLMAQFFTSGCTIGNPDSCEFNFIVSLDLDFEESCPNTDLELSWSAFTTIENDEKFDNNEGLTIDLFEIEE